MTPLPHIDGQSGSVARERGYVWTATRNDRALGFLLWTALLALLLRLSS